MVHFLISRVDDQLSAVDSNPTPRLRAQSGEKRAVYGNFIDIDFFALISTFNYFFTFNSIFLKTPFFKRYNIPCAKVFKLAIQSLC